VTYPKHATQGWLPPANSFSVLFSPPNPPLLGTNLISNSSAPTPSSPISSSYFACSLPELKSDKYGSVEAVACCFHHCITSLVDGLSLSRILQHTATQLHDISHKRPLVRALVTTCRGMCIYKRAPDFPRSATHCHTLDDVSCKKAALPRSNHDLPSDT